MFKYLLSFITAQDAAIRAETAKAENRDSLKPGMIWLACAQAVYVVGLLSVGWLASLAFKAFTGAPYWLMGMAWVTPMSAAIVGLQAWVLSTLGFLATAYSLDFFMSRLFKLASGRQALTFNVLVKSVLPWQIFILIPVLGWIALAVGAFLGALRVAGHVYEEKDWVRRFAGVFVSWVVCGVLEGLAVLALVPLVALAYSFHGAPKMEADQVTTDTAIADQTAAMMNRYNPDGKKVTGADLLKLQDQMQKDPGSSVAAMAALLSASPEPTLAPIQSFPSESKAPIAAAPGPKEKPVRVEKRAEPSPAAETMPSGPQAQALTPTPIVNPTSEVADRAKKELTDVALKEGAKQVLNFFH